MVSGNFEERTSHPAQYPEELVAVSYTHLIDRLEAIILSMTPRERQKPSIINVPRKKRIAAGSGTKIEDVNRLLKQFDQTCKMMKELSRGKFNRMMTKGRRFRG